jgi:signal transduction histidine kinase
MRSLAPNHEEYWFEIYGKVAVTGEPVRFTNEAKALNRWYDVYAFPVGEGKIRNVAILFNDITEHKKLEKQLQEKERLAAIGATAGMVGHDIRNPLQTVTGELYLAKGELKNLPEGDARESLKESLDIIEEQTIYVNKIVADLQDYAKPLTPKPEEVNLENTIKAVLSSVNLRSTDQPEGINIEYNISEDFPKLKVDESYLRRIIQNLVTNAIQAMPNGGSLTINASRKKGKAIVTVEDTGEGIPINVRDKLFTPLVTTKSKGQGFGLAVVKRFTEGMGGTVTFESEVGKGTKFIISLPVIRGES